MSSAEDSAMSIAIVFHSGYGHTAKQAAALQEGAGATATLVEIDPQGELSEAQWQVLDEAKAIVFGSPTYMGMVSWQFKKFADASSKRWFNLAWKDKLAAGFTNSASMNGDKSVTIHYLITLAMQHGMIWVGTGMMPANQKGSVRDDINYLGGFPVC
uniref:flavodoxin family protein n=1 Tax=Thaumasiovibrio occultus TaxID=1891184 RepID=UPI00192D1C94|nr:flavodoxin family protein [Thaumasiovibrio occultus]